MVDQRVAVAVSTPGAGSAGRRLAWHVAGACAVLAASIWLSSGTLAPYAATLPEPLAPEPCRYLYNIDHLQFRATFALLSGAPREQWQDSVVLRRLLFPLFAYPWMKWLGFETGGFVASLLLHLLAFFAFIGFLRRDAGERGCIAGAWLLATYPGISYWAGLPYSYAAIVPCSLLIFLLLRKLEHASHGRTALICASMGVLFTAYDFLPIFGVAALLLLAARRRWGQLAPALAALVAPTAACVLLLRWVFHVPFTNGNTAVYGNVITSWLHPDWPGWRALLAAFPRIAVENYFFSNFIFLPALFAALLIGSRRTAALALAEKCILAAAAFVFVFNNAAPPYGGWQMRGLWIARIYQPVFVVFVAFAARAFAAAPAPPARRLVAALVACTSLLDASVAFGPALHVPWTGQVDYWFYRHSSPEALEHNLQRYGRRPLGFCAR